MSKPIIIVQGLQWGSEAKGAVAAYLSIKRNVKYAVRTGAVNAGHTVYWPEGKGAEPRAFKMQQLPTAWVNPRTTLVVGAGAFVNPEILAHEIAVVSQATGEDLTRRLVIDDKASLHLSHHQTTAKGANRHHRIGATGKGCSVAIVDKMNNRGNGYELFKQWWTKNNSAFDGALRGIKFADTVDMLHSEYDAGGGILLEGTQGSLLDLHLGPYPYVTHKQTQASQWVTEAGLSPSMDYEIVGVARTFPIRVAGNSGPMMDETTWPNIARDINRKLMNCRMPQRVKDWALQEFEKVWIQVARSGKYTLPTHHDGSENYDLHKWSRADQELYRVALSELPADVLRGVSLQTHDELGNLFEYTTVTHKLRRVSQWNAADVAWSARVNRVDWVAMTFWNYWYPEVWGQTNIDWMGTANMQAHRVVEVCEQINCPVRLVGTGPLTSHFIPTMNAR